MTSDSKEAQLKAAKKRYAKLKKERKAAANTSSSRDATPIEDAKQEGEESKQDDVANANESTQEEQAAPEKVADPKPSDEESKSHEAEVPLEEEHHSAPAETNEDEGLEKTGQGPAEPTPNNETTASEIADLKQENEDLRLKVESLTNRIKSLESENMLLRGSASRELSLSPLPSNRRHGRSKSIVADDLYAEKSKIGSTADEMKKWQGWQLDLRDWRLIGLGPQVTL